MGRKPALGFYRRHALWSLLWAIMMSISALTRLWLNNGLVTSHLSKIIVLVFISALIAYPLARISLHIIDRHRRFETQLAGAFLCLSVFTIGLTSAFYALTYWSFFQQWHDTPFTFGWGLQFLFTTAGALYQFAVIGLKLYLPFGLVFLALISWLIAKRRI